MFEEAASIAIVLIALPFFLRMMWKLFVEVFDWHEEKLSTKAQIDAINKQIEALEMVDNAR